MTTTFNKERRVIETVWENEDGTQISITTQHSKERKALITSVYRQRRDGAFVRFAIYEDRFEGYNVPVTRYGAKAIEAEHSKRVELLEEIKADLLAWGKECHG